MTETPNQMMNNRMKRVSHRKKHRSKILLLFRSIPAKDQTMGKKSMMRLLAMSTVTAITVSKSIAATAAVATAMKRRAL